MRRRAAPMYAPPTPHLHHSAIQKLDSLISLAHTTIISLRVHLEIAALNSWERKMGTSGIHEYGTKDGWHGKIEEGGEFPPEKDRYHLYAGILIYLLNCISCESSKHCERTYSYDCHDCNLLSAASTQLTSRPHRPLLSLRSPRPPGPLPETSCSLYNT